MQSLASPNLNLLIRLYHNIILCYKSIMTKDLKYIFSKKFENVIHSVEFNRLENAGIKNSVEINFNPSPITSKIFECKKIEQWLFHYNDNPNHDYRRLFNNIFPDSFKKIGRVIGITSSLGHFFIRMDTYTALDEILTESFSKYFNGHCFIDWMEYDNQIIYFPCEERLIEFNDSIRCFFENGLCGKVEFFSEHKNHVQYYFESEDIDSSKARTLKPEFTKVMIKDINDELRSRFPSR